MAGDEQLTKHTWTNHRFAALCVRTVAWAAPIAVSVVATALVSRAVDRPSGWLAVAAWWVAMSLVATVVLILTDRAARRLLPLAALLRLSLVFPDEAPSRFRTALRTGTVHQLEQRVAEVKRSGLPSDPTDAAETLIELVAALSAHDRLTRGHAERVRAYSRIIGEEMRLDESELDRLHWAGLLHDVGKLFVPSEILNKPGALTPEEFEVIKQHPGRGAELCEPIRPWLGDWVDAVGQHHERWDGQGYPSGLAGRDISLAGRVVAVADAFDVMTSVRSYKEPQDAAEARAELARCAGSHFDPDVVRAFLGVSLGRLRLVMGPLSWLAQAPVIGRVPLVPAAGAAVTGALTAVTLVTGGLLHHPHHDSGRVAVEAPVTALPFPDGTDLPFINGPVSSRSDGDRLTSRSDAREQPDATSSVVPTTVPPADGSATSVGTSTTAVATGPANLIVAGSTTTTATAARPSGNGMSSLPTVAVVTPTSPTTAPPTPVAAPATAAPTTAVATATTAVASVPSASAMLYLGAAGSSADDFSFSTTPQAAAPTESDYDGDGKPGLTIQHSDLKLTQTDGHKFQNWDLVAAQPVVLNGPVVLDLWSTAKDFKEKDDVDYSIWLLDCAADGSNCTVVASTINVHVPQWNGGVKDWVERTIPVGTVDYRVQAGRMLRLRVMFDRHDVWMALSADRPSRLVVT